MKPGGGRSKRPARAQSVLTQGGVVLNCVASKTDSPTAVRIRRRHFRFMMRVHTSPSTNRRLLLAALSLAFVALLSAPQRRSAAQSPSPVLISEADSTRAVALESATRLREPFAPTSPVQFGADARTRVMLFALNLRLAAGEDASAVTADAQDAAGHTY